MIVVVQRVLESSVSIDNRVVGAIGGGMMLLLGIEEADTNEDIEWLVKKITNLRIFNDANGTMNLSAMDVRAELLVISQFTLHASMKKGNRPSYIKAARPDIAVPLYEQFILQLKNIISSKVATGQFGADMQVHLINDGPVTIIIDSKNRI